MNHLLAFECSSPQASMAIIRQGQCLREVRWETGQRREHRLFEALDELLDQAGIPLQSIDAFAVGRGPGNFTGMRVSLATAQAMALPEDKIVVSLSSGTVLAATIMDQSPEPLAVVGDARRGQCWYSVFSELPTPGVEANWQLCPYEKLLDQLPEDTRIISSEIDRLAKAIPALNELAEGMVLPAQFPTAGSLGVRAWATLGTGRAGEEHEPLYMHPAV